NGNAIDGRAEPLWDTLLGIYNPNSARITCGISVYAADGLPTRWPDGSQERQVSLEAHHSFATTFIKGNVWPDPVQDFIGYVVIACTQPIAIHAIISGGG